MPLKSSCLKLNKDPISVFACKFSNKANRNIQKSNKQELTELRHQLVPGFLGFCQEVDIHRLGLHIAVGQIACNRARNN